MVCFIKWALIKRVYFTQNEMDHYQQLPLAFPEPMPSPHLHTSEQIWHPSDQTCSPGEPDINPFIRKQLCYCFHRERPGEAAENYLLSLNHFSENSSCSMDIHIDSSDKAQVLYAPIVNDDFH